MATNEKESDNLARFDSDPLSEVDTEAKLAEALNGLSVKERLSVLEDIHGVAPTHEEDPQMVEINILKMGNEIQRHLNSRVAKAYLEALEKDPEYVQDEELRLMFLRADDFDIHAATQRFLKFFQFKLSLFGKGRLCSEILLEHLSQDDLESLAAGTLQELLKCDQSGRVIIIFLQQMRNFVTVENQMRAIFYFAMTLVRNRPDVQRKGVVFIFYNTSRNPKRPNPAHAWRFLRLREALPYKYVSHHLCYNHSGLFSAFRAIWWYASPSSSRLRVRRHTGPDYEIQRQLQCFGIPLDVFPVDEDGTITSAYIQEWLKQRRELEGGNAVPQQPYNTVGGDEAGISNQETTMTTPMSVVCENDAELAGERTSLVVDDHIPSERAVDNNKVEPTSTHPPDPSGLTQSDGNCSPNVDPVTENGDPSLTEITAEARDVLLGRGKPIRRHPGNVKLRILLESHAEEYNTAAKFEKGRLVKKLVQVVTSSGARFLKKSQTSPKQWVLADEKATQTTVSQFFRSSRKRR